MYLDYSKLAFDRDGNPEYPELLLQTMGGDSIGTIPGAGNLKIHVKFAEPSEIEFDVSSVIDGKLNWIYDEVTGHKLIYTECYGIYVLMNPKESSDGIRRTKNVKGYSLEYTLNNKKFFIEEGTFKFYDPLNARNPATIIGRVLEIAPGWSVGYVSPAVAQRYRTFDQYDNYLLPFLYGDVKEKFRCVAVFDPYQRTISVYDADEPISVLPIYLDFHNLLSEITVEELSDKLITALRPYGADQLDIHAVNPIGTNWIYDLSYFISNGDLRGELADKWQAWQTAIMNRREYYKALVALRASGSASLTAAQAHLTDLNGELESLKSQRNVTVQALALSTTDEAKASQQQVLDYTNGLITAKEAEIEAQQSLIAELSASVTSSDPMSYSSQIQAIVSELSFETYFTEEERRILSGFLIEQDLTEETFVASTVDATVSGETYAVQDYLLSVRQSELSAAQTGYQNDTIYSMAGGELVVSGVKYVSGDIIRGTLDLRDDNSFVASFYTGSISDGEMSAQSGILTVTGTLTELTSDIASSNADGLELLRGSMLQFRITQGQMFLTANVSDYQKYAVETELYDFAVKTLKDYSRPTYEFSVDSGNFLFAKEFAPFRNSLELGKSIYVRLNDEEVITPYLLEFELDFEDHSNFKLVFSSQFQRADGVNTLKEMLAKSYSFSRSFDANKYIYGQTVDQASSVSKFMNSAFDSAANTIIAAKDQSVIIDGSGIDITSSDTNDPYLKQFGMHITNGMIAFTKDNWQHAELAIGVFKTENGYHSGINAEVVAGKLICGNNLVLENQTDQGVMQFKVDASGAWLYNSTFLLAKDNGGKILMDPKYGIATGSGNLYTVDGTTVRPSFIDSAGNIIFDHDDMPKNANFYLDMQNGDAYFRGKIVAESGEIGGYTIADSYLHSGSGVNYVALNGAGDNQYGLYAMWAGADNPANAPFWIKKDGSIRAKQGEFSGYLQDVHGGFCSGQGNDGHSTTYGAKMYGSNGANGDQYLIVTNAGVRAQVNSAYVYLTSGTFRSSFALTVDSDRRKKDRIAYDIERYEPFFDLLRPASFVMRAEMNTPDPHRHIGFIAQDVESAMLTSGLAADDLALLDKQTYESDDGKTETIYGLRYSEAIALCVHMIQKLKERINDLEAAQTA